MTPKQNKELEHIRLFVANLMNEEQSAHSNLINTLHTAIYGTRELEDTFKILTRIYEAKLEILDKIYKEIQGV